MKYLAIFFLLLLTSCTQKVLNTERYDLANSAIDSILDKEHEMQALLNKGAIIKCTLPYQHAAMMQYSFVQLYLVEQAAITDNILKDKLTKRYNTDIHKDPAAFYAMADLFTIDTTKH